MRSPTVLKSTGNENCIVKGSPGSEEIVDFLLNGGIGLLLGWLYRKYGLRYAMIAHAGCHLVSKLIWILFI